MQEVDIRVELGKLIIKHPNLIGFKSHLMASVAAAATSSTVENNDQAATDDYILFGGFGEEKSEIALLTGTSGSTTISHSGGLTFAHGVDTPVQEIPYNQVEIHTASTQTGTYSLAATLDLSVDEPFTEYVTAAATWYKIRYKNENGTTYSAYSPVVVGAGHDESTLGWLVHEVAEELSDLEHREWSYNQLRSYARRGVIVLAKEVARQHGSALAAYDTQSLTASTPNYDLPARFISFRKVDVAFDGSTSYRATVEREDSGLPNTTYYTSDPRITRRGTQYHIRPTPTSSAGTAYLWFQQYPAQMSDDDDTHGLPYGAHEVIKDFMLWRAWLNKDNNRARNYKSDYYESKEEFMLLLSEGDDDYRLPTMKSRSSDLEGLEYHVATDF